MEMLDHTGGHALAAEVPEYFKLPEREDSWKIGRTASTRLGVRRSTWLHDADGRMRCLLSRLWPRRARYRRGLIIAPTQASILKRLIRDDVSGNLVGRGRPLPAERGVRIRLLDDDAITHEIDAGLLSLDDHENIEVRVLTLFRDAVPA